MEFRCIQQAYASAPEQFNSVYKAAIRAGYHPSCWREATIAVIRKPNKPYYTIPKAYSPVSLLNGLGKISEKIVATRLAFMAEKHHLRHCWQVEEDPKGLQSTPASC